MQLETYPSTILRAAAIPVKQVSETEQTLLVKMLDNMQRWQGIGLAAPQIGRLEQLIVAEADGERLLLANPKVLETDGCDHMEEGCLSLPQAVVEVERPAVVWIRALDFENRLFERRFDGLLARVLQHEVDHLHGKLIIDHGPSLSAMPETAAAAATPEAANADL